MRHRIDHCRQSLYGAQMEPTFTSTQAKVQCIQSASGINTASFFRLHWHLDEHIAVAKARAGVASVLVFGIASFMFPQDTKWTGQLALRALQECVLTQQAAAELLQTSITLIWRVLQFLQSIFWLGPRGKRRTRRGSKARPANRVAVVLQDKAASIQQLDAVTYLLLWCFEAGQRDVLLFEQSGWLKQDPAKLLRRLQAYATSRQNYKIAWQTDESNSTKQECSSNGTHSWQQAASHEPYRSWQACNVTLLSLQDTFRPILECENDKQGIKSNFAESAARQVFPCDLEPAFVMVIGECLSTAGYPPWALRFSELYHLGPLHRISSASVQAAVKKYSFTTQRFGT